jgi:hypothetical protein
LWVPRILTRRLRKLLRTSGISVTVKAEEVGLAASVSFDQAAEEEALNLLRGQRGLYAANLIRDEAAIEMSTTLDFYEMAASSFGVFDV